MKVSTMRNRLHEAISLAPEEKIRMLFHCIPLEISRHEFLTLEQLQVATSETENFVEECMEEVRAARKMREEGAPADHEKATREKIRKMKDFLFVLFKEDGETA